MTQAFVDIRVPTFRRPALLERALRSVIGQNHPNWHATVLDDCPEGSAKAVVESLSDTRISHKKNQSNPGATPNLDRAFSSYKYAAESSWATVLEDDNALHPKFLSENLKSAYKNKVKILQRNAYFAHVDCGGIVTKQNHTTLEYLHGTSPHWLSWHTRFHLAFTRTAIANLGLFWNLNSNINLSVGVSNIDSFTQEQLRSIIFTSQIWYEPQPLAWAAHFEKKPEIIKNKTTRNRLVRRSRIAFMRFLLDLASQNDLQTAINLARTGGREESFRMALAEAGHLPSLLRLKSFKHAPFLLKGFLLTILHPNPLNKLNFSRQ